MPLTPQELALCLGRFIEVESIGPESAAELAACINAALQEIWEVAPTALRFARVGVELRAPVSVTLDLENGSTAIDSFGGYQSWMEGCSIRIDGTEAVNEVLDEATLLLPYSGPTASSISATLYSDCVTLDGETMSLIDPVSVVGVGMLRLMGSASEFDALRQQGSIGTPECCRLDTHAFPDPPRLALRLRLYPAPDRALQLTYGARLNLASVTPADLQSSDPVRPFPIPGGWVESVLLPLALQRLSLHPDFVSPNLKTELPRQIAAAYRILRGTTPRRGAGTLLPVFR